jgi:hypothetical protein
MRTAARAAGISAAILAATALFAGPAATASTPLAKATVYNNIPSPLPGNVASVGFEATGASEFGGQVGFAGTNRTKPQVTVVMSSWGCQSGFWYSGDCSTAKKAKFNAPLTVNVYKVGDGGEPGTLIGTVTHTFAMPYRPSANYTKCSGDDAGKWYDKSSATCYNGRAFTLKVKLGSLDLPDTAIVSVAYNTTHYGYSPIGESAPCFTSSGGCAYDALNVGTGDSPPSVGSQPQPDDAYFNSTQGSQYCDGGAGGTGTFRLDAGCWTGYQPAFKVSAS